MEQPAAGFETRSRVHALLTLEEPGMGARLLRVSLIVVIIISVATAIAKSVPAIARAHPIMLDFVLLLTTYGFAIEYLVRIWVAAENPGAAGAARERLRYVFSLPGVIDLLAAIPFSLAPLFGLNVDWLDIVPVFKLLRYTTAFQFLVEIGRAHV